MWFEGWRPHSKLTRLGNRLLAGVLSRDAQSEAKGRAAQRKQMPVATKRCSGTESGSIDRIERCPRRNQGRSNSAGSANGEIPPRRRSSFECERVYVQSMDDWSDRLDGTVEMGLRRGTRSRPWQTDLLGGSTTAKDSSL